MNFSDYSRKLDTIKFLIESGSAVTAITLSLHLEVSKSTIYRMTENLRDNKIPIMYCNRSKKYFVKN